MSNNVKKNNPVKRTAKDGRVRRKKPMDRSAESIVKNANREAAQKRLIFLIAAAVFLIGIAMSLNRNNNSNKYIGTVFVMSGNESAELKGYKVQKQYEDKITEYDVKSISELESKNDIPDFSHNSDTAVSFTGSYLGDVLYSVYDMDYEPVYSDKASLSIPTKNDDGYIVKIDVKWGKSKNNVIMRYYFKISS